MNAIDPVSDLFGSESRTLKKPFRPFGREGFIRAAKVPLELPPAPKGGARRVRCVDSFAGGGGASNGIKLALETLHGMELLPAGHPLDVDYAINHDEPALAMHAVNHPDTIHLPHNVWKVSLREILGDDLFGLLWLSPDCRDHSPAKGGPITSRSVRDLAWVLMRWLKELPDWQRPRAIFLENVPAFSKWSPLIDAPGGGYMRDESRLGEVFARFVTTLAGFGYSVGWKELVACEYGDPTIRKRFQLVARRDGQKVVWPKPTHGDPKSAAVKAGKLLPWPVAADIIDFERPCPSIFMTRQEAKEYTRATGVRIIRPLAFKSDARIAKGVKRHVLETEEPFIVERDGDTSVPHMLSFRGDQIGRPVDEPVATITANSFIQRPGGASPIGVAETAIALFASYGQHGGHSRPLDKPHSTVKASTKDQNQIVAAYIAQHNGGSRGPIGRPATEPLSTTTVAGSQQQVVEATFIKRDFGRSVGAPMGEPLGAIMAGGSGKTQLVAAHMLSLKGSDRRDGSCKDPHPAVCASGQHSAVVTLPLMTAYYSTGGQHAAIDEPMLAVPTKARFGLTEVSAAMPPLSEEQLQRARQVADFMRRHDCWDEREFVTLTVRGHVYVVVDIGMRMLTPRELARAQGFADSYILAAPFRGKTLSETEQRHKIGNSVCRLPAAATIVENYRPPLDWGDCDVPFMEAAE